MAGPIHDKDVADQLAKLYELRQSGALTEAEFQKAKQRILGEAPPPRMTAVSPSQYKKPEPASLTQPGWKRAVLILCAIAVVGIIANSILEVGGDSSDSDIEPTPDMAARVSPEETQEPTATVEPTATAIPRTGIQTISLSIVVENDWKAWGQGCVGDGPAEWVSSDAGAAVAPDDATGTVQGMELRAGRLSDDETICEWSVTLTSRASDTYKILVGGHNVLCHSNMMLPTEDGFFAAVFIQNGEMQCAAVTDVSDAPPTAPEATP